MTKRTIETDLFGGSIKAKAINGRRKGGTNERECATVLLEWTGEPFSRVPSSGGLRWKNHSSVCGDLVCQNEDFDFVFSVETKHLKDIHIPVLLPKRAVVRTIWKQADRDAKRAKKLPIAFLRKNGMKKGTYIVFVETWLAKWFIKRGLDVVCDGGDIVGFNSEQFITIPYKDVLKYVKIKVTLNKI